MWHPPPDNVSGHSNFPKTCARNPGHCSKPFVFCWISDFTELKTQRCHVANKTGTWPHGVSEVTVLVNQQKLLKTACFMLNSTPSKVPNKKTNNLARSLHFCEFRNLTKHKWFTYSVWNSSTIFQKVRMAAIVHSFNEDSSFVEQ